MNRMITCLIRTCGRPLFPEYVRTLTKRRKYWAKSPSDIHVIIHGDKSKLDREERKLLEESGYRLRWWSKKTDGGFPSVVHRMMEEYLPLDYKFIMPMDDDADWVRPDLDLPVFLKDFDDNPKLAEHGPCVNKWQVRGKIDKGKTYTQYLATETEPSKPFPMRAPGWTADGSQIHLVKALRKIDMSFLKRLYFRTDLHLTMSHYTNGYECIERVLPRYSHVGGEGQIEHRKTYEENMAYWHKYIGDYIVSLDTFRKNERFVRSIAHTIIWGTDFFAKLHLKKRDTYGADMRRLDDNDYEEKKK
jgi:hypothetical protein